MNKKMYSVSLLPNEYRKLQRSARLKDRILFLAIGILGFVSVAFLLLSVSAFNSDKALEDVKNQNAVLEKEISELISLEAMNDQAKDLWSKVLSAYGSSPEWDDLISLVGNSVPDSIGLTSLDMKYTGEDDVCIVQGTSRDNHSISSWIKDLKKIPGIGEIKYKYATQIEENGVFQFELNLILLPGNGYRLPVKEAGHE